jgi:hypothetical protein
MEHPHRRRRGEGSIYNKPRSPFLWIKYYKAGKPIRESTRTGDQVRAARFLRQRLAEVGSDTTESPRIEQLVDDLFRDYRINEQRSLDDVKTRWRLHLKTVWGSVHATQLDSRLLARYIDGRREEHASNATINRELACLKRMYRLAYLSTPPRVQSVPHFPHLKENNVRQGFVTPEQFAELVAHCPDLWLRAMLETAYNYGWRVNCSIFASVRSISWPAPSGLTQARPRTRKDVRARSSLVDCSSCFTSAWRARARSITCLRGAVSRYVTFERAGRTCALPPGFLLFYSMTCAGQRHGTCVLPAYRKKSSCASQDGKLPASSSATRS